VKIDFTAPATNAAAIDAYQIVIKDSTGTFVENTVACDGSDTDVKSNTYCLAKMVDLRASPLSLAFQAQVVTKIRAHNARGWSAYSVVSTDDIKIQTEPSQMGTISRGSNTNADQIEVSWSALSSPNNGDSTITSYHLQWDQGTATWADLVGASPESTAISYTHTAVTTGASYKYRVRAKNTWGYGAYSNEATLKASGAPDTMATATTSIDSATGGVRIAWTEPASNGETISAYIIKIKTNAGAWSTTSDCDGSSSTVITNKYCIVPMATLADDLGGTYALAFDALVEVTLSATNSIDSSSPSTANTAGA
jgi:hypothetical protein